MHIFNHPDYNFLRWRWPAMVLSWVVIIAGIITIATKGIPLSTEFSGGSEIIVKFDQPTSVNQVRSALDSAFKGGNAVVQTYDNPSLNEIMVRVPTVGAESGDALSSTKDAVVKALNSAGIGSFKTAGSELVSSSVGRDLRNKGFWATVLSLG